MCGRYYLELTSLVQKLLKLREFKTGEIFPGDTVPILTSKTQVTFRQFGRKISGKMLLNARCETVLEKPTFQNLKHGLVLASSYYEWDKQKVKYQFFFHENEYMCCLYDHDYFYIITTYRKKTDFSLYKLKSFYVECF